MKFNHKCIEARWNEETSKWHAKFQVVGTGEVFEDVGDVFMTGIGALNEWKWPSIEGLHTFKGKLLHSANWDPETDLRVRIWSAKHLYPLTSYSPRKLL
jgi:cation diffusion facilitator CzcD-associated flavoprotein CzcO